MEELLTAQLTFFTIDSDPTVVRVTVPIKEWETAQNLARADRFNYLYRLAGIPLPDDSDLAGQNIQVKIIYH